VFSDGVMAVITGHGVGAELPRGVSFAALASSIQGHPQLRFLLGTTLMVAQRAGPQP